MRAPRALDLRLLLPALSGWTLCAATLPWDANTRLGVGAALALIALAGLGLPRRSSRLARLPPWALLSMTACALVLVASGAQDLVRRAGPVDELAAEHAEVTLTGTVLTEPRVLSRAGADDVQVLLTVRVEQVTGRGEHARARAPVLLAGGAAWQHVRWHERVQATGRLRPAEPGDTVLAALRARGEPRHLGPPGLVARAAEHVRAGLRTAAEPLPGDARGLLPALVIGDTSRTPDDLTEAMLATGMTHLSAVSGSNVAIVLAVALGAARLAGLPRWARPCFALAVLAGFVVLARPEPSVIRAAAMGAIGLLGLSRSRRAAGLPVLSCAVLVLLVVDPWLSRSYGFALSTLATLGLLVFTRSWGAAIGRRLPRRIRSWGPALAIPVAAQAMCAPVIVLLQGSVSVVGVLANLLAAPLVAPATVMGVSAALAAPVWGAAARMLCWAGALPALGIARIARSCATVPGGTLPWPDGGRGALLLAALTVLVLLAGRWVSHHVRLHPLATASAALLVLGAALPTSSATWPPPGWRLVACDVGQGDALVVSTTPGHAVLVDSGPDPAPVAACLRRLDVHTLDSVVLTHFHADHVEGLPGALAGRGVREILTTPVRDPPYEWRHVEQWAAARGIPVRELQAGDRLAWDGVTAEVWWPARRISAGSVPNNSSVVLAVHAGGLDALLMGDVEREAAHAILLELRRDPHMAEEARSFDVVKTAHHGSANLDEDLMAVVRAPAAVISVGKDNDYGHPAPKHLEVLRRNGYTVYRTDQRGDIALVAHGEDVSVTWRRR